MEQGPRDEAALQEVPPGRGTVLLALARRSLEDAFRDAEPELRREPLGEGAEPAWQRGEGRAWLRRPGATFVTLFQGRRGSRLRGCVGSILPRYPLDEDVWHNARAAAFDDPRFDPLTAEELPGLTLEVSLLSPLERLEAGTPGEALPLLRPGGDGVVLEAAGRQGVFLPQVWEHLSDPRDFLTRLAEKAGLAADEFWDETTWQTPAWQATFAVRRFTVEEWREDRPIPEPPHS